MDKEKMRGIKIPNINVEDLKHAQLSIKSMNQTHRRSMEFIANKALEEKEYKQETLNTLKNIEKNTGDISQLVFLLNNNAEKQTEILEVMTEILSIGASQTNEEAENRYRKVMGKITQTFDDAETMEKLLGYSKMFYHSAKEYIKSKIENGG